MISLNVALRYVVVVAIVFLVLFMTYRPRVTIIQNLPPKTNIETKTASEDNTSSNKALDIKYNLVGEGWGISRLKEIISAQNCTLDYINQNKLQQDHPCVIEILKRDYLIPPPGDDVPLSLDSDSLDDRSPGQTGVILRLLKNQKNGFFVECGALDGELMSNSIDLERKHGWTGILIEANPITFKKLKKKNRKSWTAPVCLSLKPYPTKVKFQPKSGDPGHSHIEESEKTLQKAGIAGVDPDMVEVQCFPFYSILLAVGKVHVDFFSLDVEGHEIAVLKTIPFHKVFIKSLTVEWDNIPEGEAALTSFMEKSGFLKIDKFSFSRTNDVIFIKDLINIPSE